MYSPDEKRNIRAEMNRDAAPTQQEAREIANERLAAEGCMDCGEDDPEKLGRRFIESSRGEPPQTVVLCEDCLADADPCAACGSTEERTSSGQMGYGTEVYCNNCGFQKERGA